MYSNFFKYHVQDRDYNRTEVASLINNNSDKHHLLANKNHFYSLGTTAETVVIPAIWAIPAIIVIGLGLATETALYGGMLSVLPILSAWVNLESIQKCDDCRDILHTYYYNGVEFDRYLEKKFKPQDVKYSNYSGKEVTKFLNECTISNFIDADYYDKIVNDFLNHKYIDAEIPTTFNSGFFDWNAAVLDLQPAVIETDYVNS
ncbi:hypothetical protein [Rickettsiales endosymbiont of Stachyamoeba lipophora]|uniref:hypothetical protein n=1 Tax=Rickettsiales endosymbiont of Stachyamoeba lipophora TaxID=2486578 RepID=UPI000F647918|nr:hypothetical protein [Rickettsiales endosymbiont of Stachyamoeba lipophora]AZL16388.1 hypothetical protein EF513_07615 [Rickettsiales endosymbiont of Stachyamoeba lipophora]